jgi:hypothetical protein
VRGVDPTYGLASANVRTCLGTRMVEPRAPFLPVLASHQTYSFNLYIVRTYVDAESDVEETSLGGVFFSNCDAY